MEEAITYLASHISCLNIESIPLPPCSLLSIECRQGVRAAVAVL